MSQGNFVLANQNLEQSMNNLNSLKSAELIEIATNAAPADKAVAKAEIVRRHENRVSKDKKPIPAIAKFLGLAPANPEEKPKAPAKLKAPAKPKATEVELTEDELIAKYAKSSAAFLKNMLAKVVDPRKKSAMLIALNAKTSAVSVTTETPIKPSVGVSKQLIADIIDALKDMDASDQAIVIKALSA